MCVVVAAGSGIAPLDAGRAALATGAWAEARASFRAALAGAETPEALEGLSWASWWLDDVDTCLRARERAYRLYRRAGEVHAAARMALWLGDDHVEFHGETAVANGWFGRAARLLADAEPSPEHGWLLAFEAHGALHAHEPDRARALAAEAQELARRVDAFDVEMFALSLEGRALVAAGEVDAGFRCLDEAATAAVAGELQEILPAGWVCCYVIHACEDVRDYERAAQWCRKTEEFTRRVGIRFVNGACRAYHGGVLCRRGRWLEAEDELVRAVRDLSARRPYWRDEAVVRLAELRRRQGRLEEARELFAQAEWHPLARLGTAELLLDEGDVAAARDAAETLLRRVPAAVPTRRADALELLVRAEAAAGDGGSAAAGHLSELHAAAAAAPTAPLRAAAAFCSGLVEAARGDDGAARAHLEDAVELYAAAGAPYELARVRSALAETLQRLGQREAAAREAARALRRLEELGAVRAAADARSLLARLGRRRSRDGPLTPREVEVIRFVAQGLGDRGIAQRLTLSEHTVHRHVANILAKLGCSTRAAAVARAAQLGLLR